LLGKEDLQITGFDVPYMDVLQSALSIKLNSDQASLKQFTNHGQATDVPEGETLASTLFPFTLKKADLLSIQYQFLFKENDPNRYHFYDLTGTLHGKTADGQDFTDRMYLSYRPYFSNKDLKEIIKEAGQ